MSQPPIPFELYRFVEESNRIEGITRAPTVAELCEAQWFLSLQEIGVADMQAFVKVYQPDAVLRDEEGLDVRVGRYVAPEGGPWIRTQLTTLLADSVRKPSPYHIHVRYELLHPFTDGNGRSGRMLWLWMMTRNERPIPEIGFLHCFYYQALEAAG